VSRSLRPLLVGLAIGAGVVRTVSANDAGVAAPTPAPTRTATSAPAPAASAAPSHAPQAAKPQATGAGRSSTTAAKPNAKGQKQGSASRATRTPDPATRHQVAGGPTGDDLAAGVESPELVALREAERELFPPAAPALGGAWPSELPAWRSPIDTPVVHATGVPVSPPESRPPPAEGGKDLSWLSQLELPDLPVRWDARLVRYLEMYKDDPRARGALVIWRRRAGRYKDAVASVLRRKHLPQDLVWLAMIESGFDPGARSPAGAVGMWQFMPETGRIYGLPQDRWVDERLEVTASTEAAADFLSDLYRRFASWDLAMASYNMGYAGVVVAERRYNTNDFWQLSKLEGSLPWETTLYVPKILAAAIVMHNPKVFGMDAIVPDAPVESEEVRAPFGVALSAIAQASGVGQKELEQLNPELRAARTPPKESDAAQAVLSQSTREGQTPTGWPLRVPVGRGPAVVAALGRLKHDDTALERYVVRFGETLEQIAQAHGTTSSKLADINAIGPGELVRGGTLLLVPHAPATAQGGSQVAAKTAPPAADADKPVAVVSQDLFVYPGRKRVFYKVLVGDTLKELADAMHVTVDELQRWNDLDPSARLQEGMTLQAFVPDGADLSKISLLAENDVRVLAVGTDEFFAYWEKTRRRLVVPARAGDTLETIGKRYGVSGAVMERINRHSRRDVLKDGDTVVVYVNPNQPASQGQSPGQSGASLPGACALPDPEPLGPLPSAPRPELLPKVN